MTSLYNCRHSGDQYRISKFSSHFDLEASYLVDATACECPAGHRPICRHREMLPKFINRGHIGDEWFFDHDRGGWVQGEALLGQMAEIDPLASAASTPPSIANLTATEVDQRIRDHNLPTNPHLERLVDETLTALEELSVKGGPISSPGEPIYEEPEGLDEGEEIEGIDTNLYISDEPAPNEATPLDTKPKPPAIPTIRRRV